MSHRDDDDLRDDDYYDDEDDYEDDDDEEVGPGKSTANPFTSGSYRPFSSSSPSSSSSNLPGRDRTDFNRPASSGGRDSGARPGSSGFTRSDQSSRLGSSNTPSSGGSPFSRDSRSSFGSGGKGDDRKPAASGPTGSSSRFGGKPDDSKTTNASAFSSRFGSSGQKEGEKRSTSEVKGTGGSSRFGGGGQKDDDRSSTSKPASGGGGIGSRFGGGGQKDDDRSSTSKPASGGGGIGSRFGGGGKKDDDRSSTSKPASGGGGFGSRFGGGGKKGDDRSSTSKPASSGGGFGSRLGLGGKKDDDRSGTSKPASGGGFGSKLGGFGGKKDDDRSSTSKPASSGGGIGSKLGGFGSRLGRGKKEDDRSTSSTGTSTAGRSQFGSSSSGSPSAQSSSTRQSAFGREKAGASAQPKGRSKTQTGEKTGLFGRISLPFGGTKQDRAKSQRPRTSKVPKVQGDGLSTDNKLDIIGVALVFSSLVLFFSSLSPDQGVLTGTISNWFGRLLGWGALGVPIAMLAIGVWLIVRVFGEDAPTVDPVRIWGVAMGYLGFLTLFQYIDSFSYSNVTDLTGLKFWLRISYDIHHSGGGLVGAQLYYLLVANVTEIGGFFVLLGWLVISVMFMARLSASELAIVVISAWRSFRTAQERRAVRRRAAEAERATARLTASEVPQVSVNRPAPAELPVGVTAALPAPSGTPIEERKIPITMGGRTVTTSFTGEEPEPVEIGAASASAAQQAAPSGRRLGGFGSRLLSAVPVLGNGGKSSEDEQPAAPQPAMASVIEKTETPEKSEETGRFGGLRKGLFSRGKSESQPETEKAAAPASTPAAAQVAPAQPAVRQPAIEQPAVQPQSQPAPARATSPVGKPASSPFSQPAASVRATPDATPAVEKPSDDDKQSTRLGDLLRPASKPQPAAQPAATGERAPFGRPFGASATPPEKSSEDKPAASAFSSSFRKPADAGTGPKPPATDRPAAFKSAASEVILPSTVDKDESPEDAMESLLGPARPKGTGPAPRPQTESPFKIGVMGQAARSLDDDDEDDEDRFDDDEPFDDEDEDRFDDEIKLEAAEKADSAKSNLNDRLSRLNALREGNLDRPEPQKPAVGGQGIAAYPSDARKTAEPQVRIPTESSPVRPAASAADRIKPFGGGTDTAKPAATFGKPDSATDDGKPAERPSFGQQLSSAVSAPANRPAASSPIPFDRPTAPATPFAPTSTRSAGSSPSSPPPSRGQQNWRLPDYRTLLATGSDQDFDRSFLVERARIIEETLSSFGAPGRVVEINTGPVITQFGVEPDYLMGRSGKKNRVKVSAIAQLDKDMQLALGAKTIRVEAPVPGKGFVGIEVPNEEASLVSLRDVMESEEFRKINSPLTIALGQSVDGTPVAADLGVMPHLLIAGTTGSGKSVCVNSIITSLLASNTPDKLKMIMVDPKRVELTGYNGLPHLVSPVVVELERIVGVLKWVTREMDERYKRFSNAGARNIEDFNKHLPLGEEWMPYIVVFIDELADLMMLAPDETERVITRIAALARATGIHLVIATQRPSVDVVTGLIKANFPARIAFAVAGSVDSRVILDQPGAERLLGRGDMLYMSGDSPAPVRLQGVFVSDAEINNIVHYWKSQDSGGASRPAPAMVLDKSSPPMRAASAMPSSSSFGSPQPAQQAAFWDRDGSPAVASSASSESDDGSDGQEDELYEEAVELVRRLNKASVSLLQRRLRIGYTRAARLIDIMEERGVVGPAESGSKPREVLPAAD